MQGYMLLKKNSVNLFSMLFCTCSHLKYSCLLLYENYTHYQVTILFGQIWVFKQEVTATVVSLKTIYYGFLHEYKTVPKLKYKWVSLTMSQRQNVKVFVFSMNCNTTPSKIAQQKITRLPFTRFDTYIFNDITLRRTSVS